MTAPATAAALTGIRVLDLTTNYAAYAGRLLADPSPAFASGGLSKGDAAILRLLAAAEIIDIAEAMPEEKYAYKPTPDMSTFGDQLVHVAGITQRFIDSAKGTKSEAGQPHKAMTKAEVITLLKQTFQTGQEMLGSLSDAQLLEPVKFPFGDRTVTRVTFWGLSDADSWLNRGRMNYPLLWDRQRQPKPAFDAVVDALRNAR